MPKNIYFNTQDVGGTQEQFLLEDLINESIKIWGIDVYVIPRETNDTIDWVYGEDPLKKFSRNYCVEMYVNNSVGWEGQGNFFAKFGLELRDDTTFVVARRSFMRYVPDRFNRSGGGPREGDLIWAPLMNTLFEIKRIEEERNFFTMGRKRPYFYEVSCERFRYNNEKFDTGISKLDSDLIQHAHIVKFNLAAGGNGIFQQFETVYQSPTKLAPDVAANANNIAVVQEYFLPNNTLKVAHIRGVFQPNVRVWGITSNAVANLVSYNDMLDERFDDIIDNRRLEVEANTVLDFDPANPFGNP